MNAEDAARLELAKQAYRATTPSALEVQTAVRRARLALLRPQRRRRWLLKGLVFVVLALGSLAYAKPHALGELALRSLPSLPGIAGKHRVGNAATPPPPVSTVAVAPALPRPAPSVAVPPAASVAAVAPPEAAPPGAPSEVGPKAAIKPALRRAPPGDAAPVGPREDGISDWGRVGRALAQGDEAGALAALGRLSESDDPHTRDKAELGRAQLQMARGDRASACALAQSLTRRHAGDHLERQARQLLERCGR